ncbi:MAG: putative quinol monooxygenase [Acetobacteraceae bacterium]
MSAAQSSGRIASTVTWQVNEGQIEAALAILARFVPLVRQEPGLESLTVSQRADDPSRFLFHEVFTDQAAFEAHQQTPHFRTMILEQAIPLLKHRERLMYTPL